MSDLLRVQLRLLSTEEGGRTTAILGGYRPHWCVVGEEVQSSAAILLPEGQLMLPGEEATVLLQPLFPEHWPGRHLANGTRLSAFEGNRVVGHAEVLETVRS